MNGIRDLAGAGLGSVLAQPNPENKLFIGGAPPGTDEETLRRIFAVHGEVEEVFVMRGGSRSGQACAFVRFTTAEGAVAAIQAIHGKYVMEGCQDPLVVRYADAPGSRSKSSRGNRGGGFGGYPGAPPYGPYGNPPPGMWPGMPGYGGNWGAPPPGFMPPYLNGMPGVPGGMPGMPGGMMGGYPNPQAMANAAAVAAMQQQQQQSIPPQAAGINGLVSGMNGLMMGAPAQPLVPAPVAAPAQPAQPVMVSGKPVDGVADWASYTAPDGRNYYYNAKTGVSSWTKPQPPAPAQSPSPPTVGHTNGLPTSQPLAQPTQPLLPAQPLIPPSTPLISSAQSAQQFVPPAQQFVQPTQPMAPSPQPTVSQQLGAQPSLLPPTVSAAITIPHSAGANFNGAFGF